MAHAEALSSWYDCLKTVFRLNLFSPSVSSAPWSILTHDEDGPRILKAADVFFDRRVHSALETLQKQYHLQQQLQQQQQEQVDDQHNDDDNVLVFAPPPPLIPESSSLSSDESSSASSGSSSSSCCEDEDDVVKELMVISKRLPRSHVARNNMKRSRSDACSRYDAETTTEEEDTIGEARRIRAMDILKTCGNPDRLALTLTGSKGINQDCGMIVHPLLAGRSVRSMLLGVFDGHASLGHVVSEHCRTHLETLITKDLESRESVENSDEIATRLTQLVEQVDQDIPPHISHYGGTTMSAILQLGDSVYLVNTGDSMSIVCGYIPKLDLCIVLETTERHVTDVAQERSRILRSGGWITPDGYVLYDIDGTECGLGMSRSLGDRGAPGVIATPDVKKLSIRQLKQRATRHVPMDPMDTNLSLNDVYLLGISVSDGVLDVAHVDELATCLTRAFFDGADSAFPEDPCAKENHKKGQPPLHPMVAVQHMIQTCARRWQEEHSGEYRDDITIVAAKLM